MRMSTPLREIILKGGSPVDIKRAALRGGMRSLRQAALRKLKVGQVSVEEVLTVTVKDEEP
jgi:type II secretory ATPase GspE/PulE/Tfp pilus assembly ATPase PilB-like protein